MPVIYKKPDLKPDVEPEVKTEVKDKTEENEKPKTIVEILIEFGLDSTIQGLNYIFYPSQASERLIL